jgi:hypothetical protein
MNEVINKILKESEKEVWGNCPYNGSPIFEGYEVDQEKCINLIVKEAMYVGRLAQIKGQIVDCEIKDHFGIK